MQFVKTCVFVAFLVLGNGYFDMNLYSVESTGQKEGEQKLKADELFQVKGGDGTVFEKLENLDNSSKSNLISKQENTDLATLLSTEVTHCYEKKTILSMLDTCEKKKLLLATEKNIVDSFTLKHVNNSLYITQFQNTLEKRRKKILRDYYDELFRKLSECSQIDESVIKKINKFFSPDENYAILYNNEDDGFDLSLLKVCCEVIDECFAKWTKSFEVYNKSLEKLAGFYKTSDNKEKKTVCTEKYLEVYNKNSAELDNLIATMRVYQTPTWIPKCDALEEIVMEFIERVTVKE